MKRILMLSHSSGGGGAEMIFLKVLEVLEKENKIIVALNSNKGYLAEQLRTKGYNLIFLKNFYLNSSIIKFLMRLMIWNSVSIFKLLKYSKKNNIDCIYSSSIINYLGVVVSLLLKKTHIWHIHEMNNPGHQWFSPRLNFLVRYFFKKSKLIFISEGVKESWFKRLELQETDVSYEIIYNSIKELELGRKKEQNNKKIKIGCAGYFCKNKNQKLLIESFIRLKKNYKNIHLILAGNNVIEGAKKIIGNELNSEDYSLYDYMDIQKFYEQVDILVLPSYSEAWPLVIFEAMKMNVLTVITTESSLKEVLRDGENTYFINPFDERELYDKLEYMILNYEKIYFKMVKNNEKLLKKYKFNYNFEKKISFFFKNN